MTEDLYNVLGISKDASPQEIQKAFRRRIIETHPDKGGSPEEARLVIKSYEILSDPIRKAKYDATGDAEEIAPDNSHVAVIHALSRAVVNVIGELLGSGFNPCDRNFIEDLRLYIQKQIKERAKIRKEIDEVNRIVTDTISRIKEEKPFLEGCMRAQLAEMQLKKKILDGDDKCYKDALEHLKTCKFDMNKGLVVSESTWLDAFLPPKRSFR